MFVFYGFHFLVFLPSITDWFDGLHTFMRYICHKSWLGGWFLPQKKSYFALQLPKDWWIFGLDLALHGDIDVYQFKFFADLCRTKVHCSYLVYPFVLNWKHAFAFVGHYFYFFYGTPHSSLSASTMYAD